MCTDGAVAWILNDKLETKNESMEKVRLVTENIKSVFSDLLNSNEIDWVDEETEVNILKKNNNMKFKIGYPDINITSESIDEYYKNVRFFINL